MEQRILRCSELVSEILLLLKLKLGFARNNSQLGKLKKAMDVFYQIILLGKCLRELYKNYQPK